jgi:hypothetical protein
MASGEDRLSALSGFSLIKPPKRHRQRDCQSRPAVHRSPHVFWIPKEQIYRIGARRQTFLLRDRNPPGKNNWRQPDQPLEDYYW